MVTAFLTPINKIVVDLLQTIITVVNSDIFVNNNNNDNDNEWPSFTITLTKTIIICRTKIIIIIMILIHKTTLI